jgi:hypothetical protein
LSLSYQGAVAQQSKVRSRANPVRVSKPKPTVYVSFVRFGRREPRYNNESEEGVYLRVYNNTKWPLTFYGMDWFTSEEREMRVFYGVEEVPEPRDAIRVSAPMVGQPPPPGSSPEPALSADAVNKAKPEESHECKAPPDDWGIHVVSPITLPPGRSTIFSVPREALCKNLKIYLKYNYSWERHDRYRPFDDEPEHRVFFAGSDLPRRSSLR